jgi:hypothetical protein
MGKKAFLASRFLKTLQTALWKELRILEVSYPFIPYRFIPVSILSGSQVSPSDLRFDVFRRRLKGVIFLTCLLLGYSEVKTVELLLKFRVDFSARCHWQCFGKTNAVTTAKNCGAVILGQKEFKASIIIGEVPFYAVDTFDHHAKDSDNSINKISGPLIVKDIRQ